MRLLPPTEERRGGAPNDLEILDLSGRHVDYLGRIAHEMNPAMPASFGLPHLIRAILDRVEESGIDLTDACSEEEIARLATHSLARIVGLDGGAHALEDHLEPAGNGALAPGQARDAHEIEELVLQALRVYHGERAVTPTRDRRPGRY